MINEHFKITISECETVRGSVRHKVAADGNSGYTAFGATRAQAERLLNDNINNDKVIRLLRPIIEESLLISEEFYDYLVDLQVITVSRATILADLGRFSIDTNVIAAFINFDVKEGRLDLGWAHPATLQALAQIQGIEIHIWELDNDQRLKPFLFNGFYDYSCHTPDGATQRLDLLFINRDHFERLSFYGSDETQTEAYLSGLDGPTRASLFENFSAVIQLINKANISLAELVALNPIVRGGLLCAPAAVIQLINEANLSFFDLVALNDFARKDFLRAPAAVIQLINEAQISFADLVALNGLVRKDFLRAPAAVIRLINEAHISFADLVALNRIKRSGLLCAAATVKLSNEALIELAKKVVGNAHQETLNVQRSTQATRHLSLAPEKRGTTELLSFFSSNYGRKLKITELVSFFSSNYGRKLNAPIDNASAESLLNMDPKRV